MQHYSHNFTSSKKSCACGSNENSVAISNTCCDATTQNTQTSTSHSQSSDNKHTANSNDCCGSDPEDPDAADNLAALDAENSDCCTNTAETDKLTHYIFNLPVAVSLSLLLSGLIIDNVFDTPFFPEWLRVFWYTVAYLPVGLPVLKSAWHSIIKGEFFTEFFLMSIATIGAFAIGQYPEGVAVMLFYTLGELLQGFAVRRAKGNIQALLDVRADIAHVQRDGKLISVHPNTINIGETIQVRVGEKIPLDGELLSANASLDAVALTGESKPQNLSGGETVLAGSINLTHVIDVKVEKSFDDSAIARILDLVQNATTRKSKTELLIRRLAKIYTPIVTYLAVAIIVIPYFIVADYHFSTWLYRALVFLVISCPCALVISIPLGYFGGLGAASQNGLLFKGATYLDQLAKVDTVVMDKTGTVTKGVFAIQTIAIHNDMTEKTFMQYMMAVEAKSTHPIAKAILQYSNNKPEITVSDVTEIAGKGLTATIADKVVLVGNQRLLAQYQIKLPNVVDEIVDSTVLMAINGEFAGYVVVADKLKTDALASIAALRKIGIKHLSMLSGDKDSITQRVAATLGLDDARGELLPEDKLNAVATLMQDKNKTVAFIGDGINDAPVLALSDVGIAMGAGGSDAAIETADVIIQTDQLSKVVTGIHISQSTQRIIWQNIALAFAVKALVLLLGAWGMASMWQAVFADVGVTLLAIGNAIRLQKMQWEY